MFGFLRPGRSYGGCPGAAGSWATGALLALGLWGCEAPSVAPAPAGGAAPVAKIVDGSIERAREAVVFVTDGGGRCTGTLIGRRVVLTAKHCVQSPGASQPSDAEGVSIGVGSDSGSSSMEFFRVVDVRVAEGVYTDDPDEGVQDLMPNDVALLTLQYAPAVEPLEVTFEDPRGLVGQRATAVGFGQTPSNARGGIKNSVETTVEYVDDGAIFVGGTVCPGDSGGPLITGAGQVVGVVSTGIGDECGVGLGFYNRLDLHQDLIMEAFVRAGEIEGECIETGDEVCDGFDNDCDGEIDEGCLELGSDCSSDDECIGGRCDETPVGRICTASCDPLNAVLGCPEGLRCARDGDGCEGFCVPGSPGTKGYGEACEDDDECLSSLCHESLCSSPCRGNSDGCLAREACTARKGQCGACASAESVSGDLGFGEPCESDARCNSGLCVEDGELSYCGDECRSNTDCPESGHCRDGECVRGTLAPLGGHCMDPSDCAPGLFCSSALGEGFCTRQCESAQDCGDGFSCNEVANGEACVPERGVLGASCSADSECISLFCDTESGSCSRTCSKNSACGSGFECVRRQSNENANEGVCLQGRDAGDGGGCQSASGAGYGAGWLLMALGLLFPRRRRR